ncbi:MAG TPA: TPM domain-containing protein [Pirellulales bacterium]|jgi:uncharacterized protein|nr:TPM domain-containing protein [Pirellulales bacterium]
MLRSQALLLAAVAWWASHAALAAAEVTVRDTGKYVYDEAGVLTPQETEKLAGWLNELEQKTTAEVKVLIVRTTGDEPFFDFVQRHFELWKLGRKGKDNGALIAVAIDDHQFRVHTGRGLEGVMPDSWCGSLFRQVVRPQFQAGKFDQGVIDATVAVANRIADDAGVKLTGIPNVRHQGEETTDPRVLLLAIVIMLVVSYVIYRSNLRQRRLGRGGSMWGPWMGGGFGGFGGSSWGGGSFSGGSFGGGSFGGGSSGSFNSGSFGGGGTSAGGGGGGSW